MHEIFQNLAELDYLLEMNFPEYNKTRLDPKIRAKFIKSYNSKFNLDYYMDLLKANRNRQLIYQELVNYYSSNQVFFGPVLPYHASMSEIILCVNKNGEFASMQSEIALMCIEVEKARIRGEYIPTKVSDYCYNISQLLSKNHGLCRSSSYCMLVEC